MGRKPPLRPRKMSKKPYNTGFTRHKRQPGGDSLDPNTASTSPTDATSTSVETIVQSVAVASTTNGASQAVSEVDVAACTSSNTSSSEDDVDDGAAVELEQLSQQFKQRDEYLSQAASTAIEAGEERGEEEDDQEVIIKLIDQFQSTTAITTTSDTTPKPPPTLLHSNNVTKDENGHNPTLPNLRFVSAHTQKYDREPEATNWCEGFHGYVQYQHYHAYYILYTFCLQYLHYIFMCAFCVYIV